jgi:hypothetical protein
MLIPRDKIEEEALTQELLTEEESLSNSLDDIYEKEKI